MHQFNGILAGAAFALLVQVIGSGAKAQEPPVFVLLCIPLFLGSLGYVMGLLIKDQKSDNFFMFQAVSNVACYVSLMGWITVELSRSDYAFGLIFGIMGLLALAAFNVVFGWLDKKR